jgi:MOSC domain-containing protein YiiM
MPLRTETISMRAVEDLRARLRGELLRPEKRFLTSGRVGFYLHVLEEGEVGAGDVLARVSTDPERMTVREICHLLYLDPDNLEGTRKALRIRALSPGWRQSFEERLSRPGARI